MGGREARCAWMWRGLSACRGRSRTHPLPGENIPPFTNSPIILDIKFTPVECRMSSGWLCLVGGTACLSSLGAGGGLPYMPPYGIASFIPQRGAVCLNLSKRVNLSSFLKACLHLSKIGNMSSSIISQRLKPGFSD